MQLTPVGALIDDSSVDPLNIQNIGVNSHAVIDIHIADGTLHFTEASIDHTAISNIGVNSHAAIDIHIADGTIHFTEGSIDHVNVLNVGTNTHAQIDTELTALALRVRSITVENPIANDNFALFFTDIAITIQQLNFVLQGATNTTIFVRFAADRSAAGTSVINAGTVVSNTTAGQEFTSFDNAAIPAGNWVWIEITAITNTPDEIHVSAVFM